MAKQLEWKRSDFRLSESVWSRPEPDLEYAVDSYSHGTEFSLNVTAESESIHYEAVRSIEEGKRKAQQHYNDLRA